MNSREIAESLMRTTSHCVLATASNDGKPEAAAMAYACDDDWNLYFESFASYRKYKNIAENGRASVVITQHHSLQMDGMIEEIHGNEKEEGKQILLQRHPQNPYLNEPDVLVFRFRPQWVRLLDRSGSRSVFVVIKQ